MNNKLKIITDTAKSADFLQIARENKNSFTRKRKISIEDLIVSIIASTKKVLNIELDSYFTRKGNGKLNFSNTAYLKARYNLSPEAFKALNKAYLNGNFTKKHTFLAIDGSKIEIPNTKRNKEKFGYQINQAQDGPARALISGVCDMDEDWFLDVQIGKYNDSEIELAKKNIKEIKGMIPHSVVAVADRNYASLEFINFLIDENVMFIIRIPKGHFVKERSKMESDDEEIFLIHTYARLKRIEEKHPDSYEMLKLKKETKVRVVNIQLTTGETEILITNIPKSEIDIETMKQIYDKRWGVEKGYDNLKNKLDLEDFSGKKEIIIKQDIYARMLMYNITLDFIKEANKGLNKKNCKHKYQVNINQAIGFIMKDIVKMFFAKSIRKLNNMIKRMLKKMRKCVSVIRPDRPSSPRNFNRSNKHRCNLKRSY